MWKSLELPSKAYNSIKKDLSIKKLNLAYNKAKIKDDPLNFKFTSRVVAYSEIELENYAMSPELVVQLLSKINSVISNKFLTATIQESSWFPKDYVEYLSFKSAMIDSCTVELNESMPSCFAKDEHLKLFTDMAAQRVMKFDPSNMDKLPEKIEYLFDKLSNPLVYLMSDRTIITELLLSFFDKFCRESFSDLRNLSLIQKMISEELVREIPMFYGGQETLFIPLQKWGGKISPTTPKGTRLLKEIDVTNPLQQQILYTDVKLGYAMGLEIMYYLNNNDEDLFEEIFNDSGAIFKQLCLDAQAIGIFNEDTPEKRFINIKTIVESLSIPNVKDSYYKNMLYVSEILHNLIQFANNYVITNYHSKVALLLIQFAKDNKINCFNEIDMTSSGSDADEDEDDDTFETEESSERARYTYAKYNKLTAATGERKSKKEALGIPPTILDKAMATFEADKYKYEIKAKYSNTKISPEVISDYNRVAEASKMITNNLIKQIRDIKCYNFGGKNSGKMSGKLDNKRLFLYKSQKNIFYDNTYKVKEMDPVFGIILDQSGSMCGSGVKDGRTTMILLHEVLKSLGINHSIIGHTSMGYHQSTIFKYVAFKEDKGYTLNKAYNLVTMEAYNGNCDSGALYYMEQQLLRTKQKDKICIIFSDGEPTECSDGELIEQVRNMEAKGIRVIGIGINFESIMEYYPNNANGRNLKEMLDIVCKILKQYVLEKED